MTDDIVQPTMASAGVSEMQMKDNLIVELNGVVIPQAEPTIEHHTGTLNLTGEGNA